MATRAKKLKAIVHQEADGGYWAEVPDLPGCMTEGDTLDELVANLKEAVTGWLEANAKRGDKPSMASSNHLDVRTPVRVLEFA